MIVDSHCHLDFKELNQNLENILREAENNNISYMQTICTKISTFDKVKEIAQSHKNIFCSVGIHPNDIQTEKLCDHQTLVNYTKHPKVISIGETGLDYYYKNSQVKIQKESFIEHIKASQITQLPLIIHTRDAEEDTYDLLYNSFKEKPCPALIHCFTASKKFAKKVLDLGLYISFSGIVTFKNATSLQEIAKTVPLDRILVETDSPYLAPVPKRGKVNEPSYVRYTTEFLANLFDMDFEKFANITTDNFFNLFTKAKK